MILIMNICRERLHYYEFVKPVEDVVGSGFLTKHYLDLTDEDLEKADKVIICGTSLKDCQFTEDLPKFIWIMEFEKPVLGICGGMQIMGLVFGGKLKNKTEIGYFTEEFTGDFLGLNGAVEVYHLHNNYVDFENLDIFEIMATGNEVPQAVKHKEKGLYGVLFHPEVRQKDMIKNFTEMVR